MTLVYHALISKGYHPEICMFIRIPVQCLDGSEVLRGQTFAQQQFQVEM